MNKTTQKIFIEAANIFSAHGIGLDRNFESLGAEKVAYKNLDTSLWPKKVRTFLDESDHEAGASILDLEGSFFSKSQQGLNSIVESLPNLKTSAKLGVILTSTKFHHEDYIWLGSEPQEEISKLVKWVEAETSAEKVHFISNACTSGLVGLSLAKAFIEKKVYDKVLVLSYDLIGPFIYSGFLSLGALSPEASKPFSFNRKGLHLGEAFSGVLLSNEGNVCLSAIEFMNDGESAIRPAYAVEILPKLYEKMNLQKISGVIAHGTGTKYNDTAEMDALESRFFEKDFFVTGSKWSIGHSLGASSLVDVAFAYRALQAQKIFGIASSSNEVEVGFENRVLTKSKSIKIPKLLVQSLGFGGITGAAVLEIA